MPPLKCTCRYSVFWEFVHEIASNLVFGVYTIYYLIWPYLITLCDKIARIGAIIFCSLQRGLKIRSFSFCHSVIAFVAMFFFFRFLTHSCKRKAQLQIQTHRKHCRLYLRSANNIIFPLSLFHSNSHSISTPTLIFQRRVTRERLTQTIE